MDVVVDAAMNQQHLPVQLGGGKPRGGCRDSHPDCCAGFSVALGVDRVVVAPSVTGAPTMPDAQLVLE